MRPTRNFTRPATSASYERGNVCASRRTSEIVTIARPREIVSPESSGAGTRPASLESRPRRAGHFDIAGELQVRPPVVELADRHHHVGTTGVDLAADVRRLGGHDARARTCGDVGRCRQHSALDVEPGPVAKDDEAGVA